MATENWVDDWLEEVRCAKRTLELKRQTLEMLESKALSISTYTDAPRISKTFDPTKKESSVVRYIDEQTTCQQEIVWAKLILQEFDAAMLAIRSSCSSELLEASYVLEWKVKYAKSLKEISTLLQVSTATVTKRLKIIREYFQFTGPTQIGIKRNETLEQKRARLLTITNDYQHLPLDSVDY